MCDWVYRGGDKLPIWGECVPFNDARISKLDIMKPVKDVDVERAMGNFCDLLVGGSRGRERECADTVAYLCEVQCGAASDRLDDVPYLVPFVCPYAKSAVLVLPGGGCAYEELGKEGVKVARYLASQGISAFALKYRCHPNRATAALADLRRAVRWLRVHAADFGFDPARVGTLGFSAGGFLTTAEICLERGRVPATDGYEPDATDLADDRPAFAGHIYPVAGLDYSKGMLYAMFDEAELAPDRLPALLDSLRGSDHVLPGDPPQFVCWGTDDTLIPPRGATEYADALEKAGVNVVRCPVEGAGHGFGLREEPDGSTPWQRRFADWVKLI